MKPLRVAGIMTGTSADAVDVALVELSGPATRPRWRLVAFHSRPYRARERAAVLAAARGQMQVAEMAELHVALGRVFGAAVARLCRAAGWQRPDLVASHGQTVFHAGGRATLQLGEPAEIAARAGAPVVSGFRAADIAAGGQGAPLAPWGDWIWFRHPRRLRAALNLGGIANLTLLPPACGRDEVVGFDTGPGNMVLDGLAAHLSGGRERCDRNGKQALAGRVLPALLARLLADRYFRRAPPKSAGREQFGAAYLARLLAAAPGASAPDLLATACALTAATVARALPPGCEVVVSGGGLRNPALMARLAAAAPGCRFFASDEFGVPAAAKEAMLFALLGYARWRGVAQGLPRVTGARYPALLGEITGFAS